mmetsp:Transcript_11954/g.18469  ORF Transcript_11954/g.18469 Transcript_11954/m.18469 type:complete len:131 (+) Transcript_11954:779-1171(+)
MLPVNHRPIPAKMYVSAREMLVLPHGDGQHTPVLFQTDQADFEEEESDFADGYKKFIHKWMLVMDPTSNYSVAKKILLEHYFVEESLAEDLYPSVLHFRHFLYYFKRHYDLYPKKKQSKGKSLCAPKSWL